MSVRPAAVAGAFYSNDPTYLSQQLGNWLNSEGCRCTFRKKAPKAMIVPHAGYMYSGEVASAAYGLLSCVSDVIERVVVVGPNHRVSLRGIAIPSVDAFSTPLGDVPLDTEALTQLSSLSFIEVNNEAHRQEHSIEVQLPFLQSALAQFKLVPMVVGEASPHQVAQALGLLWGNKKTLLIISSDLSHFLSSTKADLLDEATINHILAYQPDLNGYQACGCHAVNGFILSAQKNKLKPRLIKHCNSGDITGDSDRVVGYASIAFFSS